MAAPSILIGSFAHETNTFAASQTTVEDFQAYREYVGEELISELGGTNTELGGVIDVANAEGVELRPAVAAKAEPGGRVTEAAYERYVSMIVDAAERHADAIDGVLLALHGAMVPEGFEDGEGPLVTAVREIVGAETPIVVTLDLHANVTDELVETADAIASYRTYPHVDMAETGRRGMTRLLDIVDGTISPQMHVERPPMLAYVPKQNTLEEPMEAVMDRARELERRADVLEVNVLPGFYQTDVTSVSFSVVVVTDRDRQLARTTAVELAESIWMDRESFVEAYPKPAEAVSLALETIETADTSAGPVVLADMGDNPGGGATADGTAILRELLTQEATNAGVAIIYDPEVVETCIDAGVGERVTVSIGGKAVDSQGDPIENLDGYVKAITDGTFVNTGPMKTGATHHLGRTVVLRCGVDDAVQILVTERRLQPLDAEIWRHAGIMPEQLDVLVVKSTNHYRADYEPMASKVIPVDSDGLSAIDPKKFDFTRLERPKYPLDEMSDGAYPTD